MSNKIRYISQDHLITRQNRAEQEFLRRLCRWQPHL